MCGRRSETAYVADMVQSCERILHELIILGEAAKHVDERRRARYKDVPWADISGMRDKLVHPQVPARRRVAFGRAA